MPYTIIKTVLALTIFRDELNMRVAALFTLLVFWRVFHWLGAARMDHVRVSSRRPRRRAARS